MATKDPLKKLIRRFPAPSELEELLGSLDQGDDRSIALVGASILEGILERFIERRLVSCDSVMAGQLFYNRGPLSDFHGKIIVAQACGYITGAMAKELLLVKSIRNAFAHAVVPISFDSEEVRRKMAESVMLNTIHGVEGAPAIQTLIKEARTFAMIVRILVIVLDSGHQEAGGKPFTKPFRRSAPTDLPPR